MDKVKNGMLTVNSENIFPIIKKWLYTEQDIFVRELVSNASDAIVKKKKILEAAGGNTESSYNGEIRLTIDRSTAVLTISDNGIGMDAEEVDKYINQIAFSGAEEFMERTRNADKQQGFIGHFGLGFYSAFMPAERVRIESLSCKENAKPVSWECAADMKYSMKEGEKTTPGTDVILYLSEASPYLNPSHLEKTVLKYFEFFPIPIYIICQEYEKETVSDADTKLVNSVQPLWCRDPGTCDRNDYIDFYRKAFKTEAGSKLWVHLYNEELGVKGLVYFRTAREMEKSIDGRMYLYCKQVFISDNAKSLIPDYLFLQNGIIDCADIPLMVSRSDLQRGENVSAISRYITEQVAGKLYGTFVCERNYYEEIWDDINPFLKFSCLKDKLFASYMEKFIIFKNLSGQYVTLAEHLESISKTHKNHIYYINDEIQQAYYINIFRKSGLDALYMTHVVDHPYIKKQEIKNTDLRFNRIDSDFYEALKAPGKEGDEERMKQIFQKLNGVFEKIFEGKYMELKVDRLITDEVSSVIIVDEEERRIRDTLDLYETRGINISGFKKGNDVLLLNAENPLVQYIYKCENDDIVEMVSMQLYDLARLGQENLEAQEMAAFIERSDRVLKLMVQGTFQGR